MTRAKLFIFILVGLFALPLQAQQEEVKLSNGISVQFLPARSGGMATAVLVCPLPDGATDAQLADISMINRFIWHGGSALGRSVQEHEYRMFALRFGGSISSQAQPDALTIQYTMPAELLSEVFTHMAVQWSALRIDPTRFESLKSEITSREQAALTSTVERQLLREVEKRIWADLPYASTAYGSVEQLGAADPERVQQTFELLRDPGHWTLVIDGALQSPELMESLEATLGTIVKSDVDGGPQQERGEAMLGNSLQMPAQLSRNHAVLAYRLPGAGEVDIETIFLLVELIQRSQQFKALQEDLSEEGKPGNVNVAADIRRKAGMLYLTAEWSSVMADDDVLDRLRFLVDSVNGEGESAETLAVARKAIEIRHWSRRESPMAYSNWIALRDAVGVGSDDFTEKLMSTGAEKIKSLGTSLLTRENSLTLVTVAQ